MDSKVSENYTMFYRTVLRHNTSNQLVPTIPDGLQLNYGTPNHEVLDDVSDASKNIMTCKLHLNLTGKHIILKKRTFKELYTQAFGHCIVNKLGAAVWNEEMVK